MKFLFFLILMVACVGLGVYLAKAGLFDQVVDFFRNLFNK